MLKINWNFCYKKCFSFQSHGLIEQPSYILFSSSKGLDISNFPNFMLNLGCCRTSNDSPQPMHEEKLSALIKVASLFIKKLTGGFEI